MKSFGLTYILLLEHFPGASGAAAGATMGMLVGSRGLLALVVGALTLKIGPRLCCLLGTGLIVLGLLLAIPALNIYYMAVTLGALVGFGLSLAETPGFLVVTDYFLEKRALANGFRAAGNPMGGILFAPLVVFLNEQFGLQGSLLMLAGVMLHLAIMATLLRPYELHEKIIHGEHQRKLKQEALVCGEGGSVGAMAAGGVSKKKKNSLDYTLLKNPAYLMYLVMVLFINLAFPSVILYLPAYGQSMGLTTYQNSIIASYVSGADFVLRIISGWIINKKIVKQSHGFIGGLVVGGVGCLLVPLCSRMWQLMMAATLFAFGLATFWSLINTLLANQFGGEKMASTWGFFRMTQGCTNYFYPSIIGLIKDATGGMAVPYIIMGSGLIMGAVTMSLQPMVARISGAQVNLE